MRCSYPDFIASKRGLLTLSQLSGVLRGVYFVDDPKTEDAMKALFQKGFKSITSFGLPISYMRALGVSLGWRRGALERIDEIADRLITAVADFADGDRESFVETICDTIQRSLTDKRIFVLRQIYGEANLFSLLRSLNPIDSVRLLMDNIYAAVAESISDWLTIFPLPRLAGQPFSLGYDGISLIDPRDEHTWETIATVYSNADKWYRKDRHQEGTPFNHDNSMWLVCQLRGTVDGARHRSARHMRSFISVLLAAMKDSPNVLMRVTPDLGNYAAQFPVKTSASSLREMHASIGPTFPAIAGTLTIQREEIARIREWYQKRELLNAEAMERYTAASQFANYALNADGLERFIYFFITLDALFGERGRVEERIRDGVLRTFPKDPLWEYKIGRLFDLRSSVVHGACVTISEWEKLDAYKRHTKTMPEADVADAAMTALLVIP